jgi:D-beta-D-heptose 7-phosphate kinase/D-beta-D-heptose 1-phosphate adenosyltransferase
LGGILKTVVLVGGFFNIVHCGHIRHFEAAKRLGDYLVVHVHRGECSLKHKGYSVLSDEDKVEVLKAIRWIDEVWLCSPTCDGTIIEALHKLRNKYPRETLILAKGGDRTSKNMPKKEIETCEKLGVKIVYGVGGEKVQSSRLLANKIILEKVCVQCGRKPPKGSTAHRCPYCGAPLTTKIKKSK